MKAIKTIIAILIFVISFAIMGILDNQRLEEEQMIRNIPLEAMYSNVYSDL